MVICIILLARATKKIFLRVNEVIREFKNDASAPQLSVNPKIKMNKLSPPPHESANVS